MDCKEIMVGTNDVLVNTYSSENYSNLDLIFDQLGIIIESNCKFIEFIPYSNILNVVNLGKNVFYVTYKQY